MSLLYRSPYDTIVVIVIGKGKEKRDFNIHKTILCNASSYFKAALGGTWQEAKKQKFDFADECFDVFDRFQQWLYSGRILEDDETSTALSWDVLFGIYIFAEKRGVPKLQNEVIDTIIDKYTATEAASVHSFRRIYDETPESSPLRRLLIDYTARRGKIKSEGNAAWFEESYRHVYPKDFLFDLCEAFYDERKAKKSTNFRKFRCDYHVHVEGEPRCS